MRTFEIEISQLSDCDFKKIFTFLNYLRSQIAKMILIPFNIFKPFIHIKACKFYLESVVLVHVLTEL